MPVSPHLVSNDGDDRREHENDEARRLADAGYRRSDAADDNGSGRAEQRDKEGLEALDQTAVW